MDNVKQMVWSFYKLIIHLITGECEVSRICSKDMHDNRMTTSFSKSLSLSKKLTIYRSIVFNGKPFNTQSAVDHVVKVKNIENTGRSMKQQLCLTNIKHCFEYLKHVNTFSESMLKKTKVVYNNQSLEHSSKLISLWTHLMGSDNRVPLDLESKCCVCSRVPEDLKI